MRNTTAFRWLRWTLVGIVSLLAVLILLAIEPSGRLLLRTFGLIGTALFILSVAMMLLTFRKARRLSPWILAVGTGVSIVCTSVFFTLTGTPAATAVVVLATGAGLMIGAGWSLTNLLFVDGDEVRARGNLWFLAVWGVTLVLPQIAGLMGGRTPYAVAVMSFVGMGLAVGNSLGLMARWRAARRQCRVGPGGRS
jgi:hypothetical protein